MLNITGQNIELTEAIKQSVQDKFNKVTNRFPILNANAYISVTNRDTRCHIEVTSSDYGKMSAEDNNEDFYVAAKNTFDKLTRQLNDAKEKSKSKKGRDSIRHQTIEPDDAEVNTEI